MWRRSPPLLNGFSMLLLLVLDSVAGPTVSFPSFTGSPAIIFSGSMEISLQASFAPQLIALSLSLSTLGITVGCVVVPQSMAYAKLAALDVQFGLYSSFMGVLIYWFFATSKDITIGVSINSYSSACHY